MPAMQNSVFFNKFLEAVGDAEGHTGAGIQVHPADIAARMQNARVQVEFVLW
jgi:hypothetical protein